MQQDIVSQHIISESDNIRNALILLDKLSTDAILFVVDENNHLSGSLTDGDIRRGFIKGLGFNDTLVSYMQQDPVYLKENEYSLEDLESVRKFKIIPILNVNNEIVDIINFRLKSELKQEILHIAYLTDLTITDIMLKGYELFKERYYEIYDDLEIE